jgi:taurine dioxygenase
MKVERLTVNIGAEVSGIRLRDAVTDDGLFGEIRALLLKHRVLFFRDQDFEKFSRTDHVAFASRFGPLESHPVAESHPDHPGLVQIYRSEEKNPYENNWHTDGLWRATPPMGAVLRCVECPEVGGDTIWVNMVEAYKRLPEDVKKKIDHLRASNSIEHSFGAVMDAEKRRALGRQHPPVEHPVVRTHPETGEKILYVGSFTTHFLNFHTPENVRCGIDKNPGAGLLLQYLHSQATIPEYQVRFRWKPHSVALWDNRSTHHYAVMDYWPSPRKMERAGIVGDVPF